MNHRFLWRAWAFVAALALSATIGAALLAAEVGDTLSLATAWITFFVAAAVLEQHHEHRL
jgi:hypothetical protein